MHLSNPSEPILAEMAAKLHANWGLEESLHYLVQIVGPLVGKGEQGELAARFLLILTQSQFPIKGTIKYTHPIRVINFLQTLFQDAWHEKLREALSSQYQATRETLQDAFKDAYVNFTHWAKAGDDSVLRADNL
jgi:hypothetical protein